MREWLLFRMYCACHNNCHCLIVQCFVGVQVSQIEPWNPNTKYVMGLGGTIRLNMFLQTSFTSHNIHIKLWEGCSSPQFLPTLQGDLRHIAFTITSTTVNRTSLLFIFTQFSGQCWLALETVSSPISAACHHGDGESLAQPIQKSRDWRKSSELTGSHANSQPCSLW